MRWVVELPADTGGTGATVSADGESWKAALGLARGGKPLNKFRCDFEGDGAVRVWDLVTNERFVLRPVGTPPGEQQTIVGTQFSSPSLAPPPATESAPAVTADARVQLPMPRGAHPTPRASTPALAAVVAPAARTLEPAAAASEVARAAPTAEDAHAATAAGDTRKRTSAPPAGSNATGGIMWSPAQVIFQRNVAPTAASPLTFRERVLALPAGTTALVAERAARELWSMVQSQFSGDPPGQYISIAVFDHAFQSRPQRPPLVVLSWKDWRGDTPEISFPATMDSGGLVLPAATAPSASATVSPPGTPSVPFGLASGHEPTVAPAPQQAATASVASPAATPPQPAVAPVPVVVAVEPRPQPAALTQAPVVHAVASPPATAPTAPIAVPTPSASQPVTTAPVSAPPSAPPTRPSQPGMGAVPLPMPAASAPIARASQPAMSAVQLPTPPATPPPARSSQPAMSAVQLPTPPPARSSQPAMSAVQLPIPSATTVGQPGVAPVAAARAQPVQPEVAGTPAPSVPIARASHEAMPPAPQSTLRAPSEPEGGLASIIVDLSGVGSAPEPAPRVSPAPAPHPTGLAAPVAAATTVAQHAPVLAKPAAPPIAEAPAPAATPAAARPLVSAAAKRSEELLAAAFEATQDIAFLQEPDEACSFAARLARELLHAAVVAVMLYDIDRDELVLQAAEGMAPPLGRRATLAQGPRGEAAIRNKVVGLPTAWTADPLLPDAPAGPVVFASARHDRRLFGVLQMHRAPGSPPFDGDEEHTLAYIATQLGAFLADHSKRIGFKEEQHDPRQPRR